MPKLVDIIIYPLVAALLLFVGSQAYCRLAVSKDFAKLCNMAVTEQIRKHENAGIRSMENFKKPPFMIGEPEHTLYGFSAGGGYELENGAGARNFQCTCACAVFNSDVRATIL